MNPTPNIGAERKSFQPFAQRSKRWLSPWSKRSISAMNPKKSFVPMTAHTPATHTSAAATMAANTMRFCLRLVPKQQIIMHASKIIPPMSMAVRALSRMIVRNMTTAAR